MERAGAIRDSITAMKTLGRALFLAATTTLLGCPGTTSPGDAGRASDDAPRAALDAPGLDAPVEPTDTGTAGDGEGAPDAPVVAPDAPVVSLDAGMCMDLPPAPTRPAEVVCSPCRPPGTTSSGGGECASDADCTAGDNGRCVFGRIGAFCSYDLCFRDSDCAADEACLCDGSGLGGGGNACVHAGCRTNNDCGPGLACSPTFGSCGHYTGFIGFECHTASDECTEDAECGAGYCAFDPALGRWACSISECVG